MTQTAPAVAPAKKKSSAPTPEELVAMRTEASNPNTTAARLHQISEYFPDEVSRNIVLPLLNLETPDICAKIERSIAWHRPLRALESGILRASPRTARLLTVACVRRMAEQVNLPVEWSLLLTRGRLIAMCDMAEHHAFGDLEPGDLTAGRTLLRLWKNLRGSGYNTQPVRNAAAAMLIGKPRDGAKLATDQAVEFVRNERMPDGLEPRRLATIAEREWQVATLTGLSKPRRPPAESLTAALRLLRGESMVQMRMPESETV